MIEVRARKREKGWKVTMQGHAGMSKEGMDIVCAAASMLLTGCVYGLKKAGVQGLHFRLDAGDAEISVPKGVENDVRIEAMLDGLEMLAATYPQAVKMVKDEGVR